MKQRIKKERVLAILLAGILLLTGCGNSAVAAVMRLTKAEGTVDVFDGEGADISITKDLQLYSGYCLDTAKQSYAWINLDQVKLVKMDETSDVELRKNGNDLEIYVNSGNLFFHVTEPLGEDESLNIRTSTMAVGIRGTCGWVRVVDEFHMQVYILEGTVHCEATDPISGQSVTLDVTAGEMADLFLYPEGPEGKKCDIIKQEFYGCDIPSFVQEEVDLAALGLELAEMPSDEDQAKSSAEESSGELLSLILDLSEYEGIGNAKCGVIPVKKDGLWGAINYQKEMVVPCEYMGFWAPNEQGNFVLTNTTSTEKTSEFMGQKNTYMEEETTYTLYDPTGNLLYEGTNQVQASGEMYIVRKSHDYLYDDIEYYRLDGTLVYTMTANIEGWINGFYDGISSVYYSLYDDSSTSAPGAGYSYSTGTFQVGELDKDGNVTWHEDPVYVRYLESNEKTLQESIEWERAHGNAIANGAGTSIFLPRLPISTINHGYYVVGSSYEEVGWITMCDSNYQFLGECDLFRLQPDKEKGFILSDYFYGGESNTYRGFYHDGDYCYNYGPNMVWVLGEQDVLVDFSLYPGMTSETVDSRIVKAVYDKIYMSDETYWLVKDGEGWGYIDHDGNEAAMFEDASYFYGQHALILEDGKAYLIDESFEKMQDLGEADSVSLYGELFVINKGDSRYLYQLSTR